MTTSAITSTENQNNRTFVKNDFMIKAIIAVERLQTLEKVANMIETCCPNVTIAAKVEGIKAGVSAINEFDPDIVLLDTRLNDGSGFDLVRHFDNPDFKVIFLSSSTDYAVKAIQFNAVDYLLKPVKEEKLAVAMNKATDMIRFEESLHQKALGESIRQLNTSQRLVLKTSSQMHVVNIEDIIRLEASNNYSTFFLDGGREIVVSKPIKEFEEQLLEHGFHRIHKSHIFNINKISHLDKADGGFVVMIDGARVPVASRKRDMLLELFDEIE